MKMHVIKNNFSAGELSPLLSTRTDIAQYNNGARQLTNVLPLVEGGIKKRPGTFYRDEAQGTARRLIPFVVSAANSFLLIVELGIIRVYNPRAQSIIAAVNTPYDTEDKIRELQYVHTRYSMYFTQGDHPVQWLRCSEDFTVWTLNEFVFDVPPVDEIILTPNTALTPSAKEVGSTIELTADAYPTWLSTTTYNVDDKVLDNGVMWRCIVASTGNQPNTSPTYWSNVPSDQIYVFKPGNVGDIVFINSGIVRITEYVTAFKVKGEVLTALTAIVKAIPKAWTLKSPAFSSGRGYPKCCTYFKQRLVLANTKTYQNTIWFSRVGDPHNFLPTVQDADSFSVASSSDQSDNILHLAQSRGVVALTGGSEFLITSDGPLTPTSVEINEHTSYGAYQNARPARVGNELLFVQRGGERVRAMSYRYEVDGLVSPELSAVASHIGEDHQGIIEATYQQEPESIVWYVMGDGKVSSITLNREQEVVAWAQHDFGGSVKSMCSIPTAQGSDRCFMLILRNTKYVLEELSFDALMDCQSTQSIESGEVVTSMGQYLNPALIGAYRVLDGGFYTLKYLGQTAGKIKFDADEDFYFQMGNTFECVCVLNPPELSGAPATALASRATVQYIYLYLYKTLGVKFNDNTVDLKTFNDNLLAPATPFSGRSKQANGGWSDLYDVRLRITHNQPLPFHMQAISIVLSINEK